MTTQFPPADLPAVATLERAASASLGRRLLRNPLAVATLAFLVLVILAVVFAPLLTPYDPNTTNARDILAPPSAAHPLGTNASGQDNWSRLLYGGRLDLLGAAITLVVSALVGISTGLVAGYRGRRFESSASWVSNLVMSLPAIVVLLAARAILGPSIPIAMLILGVLIAPAFYRVVSAAVTGVRHELYVDAARVAGLSDTRIISRHILTVVRAPAIILGAGIAAIAISLQAGLGFLGLGDTSQPSWGGMLGAAFGVIYRAPLQLLWPSLIIGLTSVSLFLFGNALRDVLERSSAPKRKRPGRSTTAQAEVSREPVVIHDDISGAVPGEELLHVDGLSVGYDQPDGSVTTVVHDVTLTVRRGEVHGLIGESGSGKTQTAFSVLRLLPPGGRILGGTIDFEGTDLAHASDQEMIRLRGSKIAYIPQEPMSNLDPSFTIGHQLTQPMRINLKINKKEAKERALALLKRVGIPDPQRTYAAYPHQISGGMAQRVLIAGAVSCNPDLLIADEPTTALDVTVQAEVLDLLRELQAEFNMGVLLVTHNFGVVADLCDRVSVMRNGRIVETGSALTIFADPRHEYTRMLFDAILEEDEPRGPLTPAASGPATEGFKS